MNDAQLLVNAHELLTDVADATLSPMKERMQLVLELRQLRKQLSEAESNLMEAEGLHMEEHKKATENEQEEATIIPGYVSFESP